MPDSPRIEELKRRVQMDPASIAFAALAEEYRRTGRNEEAIEVCRAGLQRHASYISAHVTLGRALMEVGRFDEARQELEYVLSVAPENLAAIRGLAEIHHRQGQSSDHTDYTASEMAHMLAPRTTEPAEKIKPPEKIERPEMIAAVEKIAPPEKTSAPGTVEPRVAIKIAQTVAAPAASEAAAAADTGGVDFDTVETIDLGSLLEPPPPARPEPAVAPPAATRAAAAVPEAPKVDPALERLEAFLQAIFRAREAAGTTHVA